MTEDTQARRLHDKATLGGTLTEAEQAELGGWYARQDQEEAALLASSPQASQTLDSLRQKVEAALGRLQAVTQQVQTQADENKALRRDIAGLTQRLMRTTGEAGAAMEQEEGRAR